MQYEFHLEDDQIVFHFSEGDELFGYWLKNNYADSLKELEQLILYTQKLQDKLMDDYQASRNSYYLQLTQETAKIIGLSTLNAPEDAANDYKIDFNNPLEAEVDLNTFINLLIDWRNFRFPSNC